MLVFRLMNLISYSVGMGNKMKSHPLKVIEKCAEAIGTGSRKLKRQWIENWFEDFSDSRTMDQRELWRIRGNWEIRKPRNLNREASE